MKKIVLFLFMCFIFTACHESLEDRCVREAKEYTEKYCPTPVVNNTRTDSVAFNKEAKTYIYYCSFVGKLDNAQIINQNKQQLHQLLVKEIKSNTNIKKLKDAHYNFQYIIRSDKNPQIILYKQLISKKDYQ